MAGFAHRIGLRIEGFFLSLVALSLSTRIHVRRSSPRMDPRRSRLRPTSRFFRQVRDLTAEGWSDQEAYQPITTQDPLGCSGRDVALCDPPSPEPFVSDDLAEPSH